jgi:hypothetical protein
MRKFRVERIAQARAVVLRVVASRKRSPPPAIPRQTSQSPSSSHERGLSQPQFEFNLLRGQAELLVQFGEIRRKNLCPCSMARNGAG